MLLYEMRREGLPATLYRNPEQIRRDMARISDKIREAEEMLSIRNILIEMISEWSLTSPEKWISELEETVAEARCALENLKKLNLALDELTDELAEAKCAVGM